MARVLVTGSADGLGQMAARLMVADKHRVVLHARNSERALEALAAVPGAETAAASAAIQERLLSECARLSGVPFPE